MNDTEGRPLLRAWLERSKFSQAEAARRLGVSEPLLSQWLSGGRRPGLDAAFELEDQTGVPARSWVLSKLSIVGGERRQAASKR